MAPEPSASGSVSGSVSTKPTEFRPRFRFRPRPQKPNRFKMRIAGCKRSTRRIDSALSRLSPKVGGGSSTVLVAVLVNRLFARPVDANGDPPSPVIVHRSPPAGRCSRKRWGSTMRLRPSADSGLRRTSGEEEKPLIRTNGGGGPKGHYGSIVECYSLASGAPTRDIHGRRA